MKRRASLLPFLAAAVLLAVRPAAAQVQVIIGGPDAWPDQDPDAGADEDPDAEPDPDEEPDA